MDGPGRFRYPGPASDRFEALLRTAGIDLLVPAQSLCPAPGGQSSGCRGYRTGGLRTGLLCPGALPCTAYPGLEGPSMAVQNHVECLLQLYGTIKTTAIGATRHIRRQRPA